MNDRLAVIERTECPEHGHDVSWWAVSGPLGCNQCQRSGARLVTVRYVRDDQLRGAVSREDALKFLRAQGHEAAAADLEAYLDGGLS